MIIHFFINLTNLRSEVSVGDQGIPLRGPPSSAHVRQELLFGGREQRALVGLSEALLSHLPWLWKSDTDERGQGKFAWGPRGLFGGEGLRS